MNIEHVSKLWVVVLIGQIEIELALVPTDPLFGIYPKKVGLDIASPIMSLLVKLNALPVAIKQVPKLPEPS